MSLRDSSKHGSVKPSRPERSTRGKRIKVDIDEEEAAEDESFWNQEFFAEENADIDFKSDDEKEVEDVPDSDFDESEDDDDGAAGVEVAEKRKKALKPPGAPTHKPKPKPKAPSSGPSTSAAAEDDEDEEMDSDDESTPEEIAAAAEAKRVEAQLAAEKFDAPSLRRSTMSRVAEAVKERKVKEKSVRARPKSGAANSSWRPMTQAELLEEAANTEVGNMLSLKTMLAREEEVRRKAMIVKHKHNGPFIRQHSKMVEGVEKTVWGCMQMEKEMPQWLLPAVAPAPQPRNSRCQITGKEAIYRDPATNACFSDASAFAVLRGLPPPKSLTAPQNTLPWQQQQQQQQQQQGHARHRHEHQQQLPHSSSQQLQLQSTSWQQQQPQHHQHHEHHQTSHSNGWQHDDSAPPAKRLKQDIQHSGSGTVTVAAHAFSSTGNTSRSGGLSGARFGDKGASSHVAPLPQAHEDPAVSQNAVGQLLLNGQTHGHGAMYSQPPSAAAQTPQMMALLCDLHTSINAAREAGGLR